MHFIDISKKSHAQGPTWENRISRFSTDPNNHAS